MEASKSAGTPSIDEDDAESCSAVARALDKWVRPELEGAMRGRKVDDDDKDMMRKTLRWRYAGKRGFDEMKRADHFMQVDINDVEEASQTEDFIQLFL